MRRQYHFRQVGDDVHIWDVHKLISLAAEQPERDVPLEDIQELNEPYWSGQGTPTCREIADHARLMIDADRSFPVLLDPDGRVVDGMHRVCQAYLQNCGSVKARILPVLPPPDHINLNDDELDYG